MTPKTPSLFDHLTVPNILHALGANVKSLPTIIPCPTHPEYKMYLYPDGPSLWGACPELKFSGDPIDILKLQFNVKSLDEVIDKLIDIRCLTDRRSIATEALLRYQMEQSKAQMLKNYWEECHAQIKKFKSDPVLPYLLVPYEKSDDNRWVKVFGEYLGSTTKQKFQVMLDTFVGGRSENILVAPFYDMPGRLASFMAYFRTGRIADYTLKQVGSSGGLFMSQSIPLNSDVAFASNDIPLLLRAQYHRIQKYRDPLPLVGYLPTTSHWPLWCRQVVFFAEEPTIDVLSQARRLPQSYISLLPRSQFDPLIERDIEAWPERLLRVAKPWIEVLKDHLLNSEVLVAEHLLAHLNLTSEEKGHLFFACTVKERQALKSLMDLGTAIRYTMLGELKVVEKENQWFAVMPKGGLYRISNATFRIQRSVDYKQQGIFFIGVVYFDETSYMFRAPVEEFVKNPATWLRKFMLTHAIGVLETSRSWERRLLEISHGFQEEKITHEEYLPRVGWTADRTTFRFPKITIKAGSLDENDPGIPGDQLPCRSVTLNHVSEDSLKSLLEITNSNRYFWALMLCSLHNVIAEFFKLEKKKIGIVGNLGMFERFAQALDFSLVLVSKRTKVGIRGFMETMPPHDVPYFIEFDTPFKLMYDWFMGITDKNLLVNVTNKQGLMLSGHDWLFLPLKNVSEPLGQWTGLQNLTSWVVRLVQRTKEIETKDPLTSILRLLHQGILERMPDQPLDILDEARLLIRKQTPAGELTESETFLFTLFSMLQENEIKLSVQGHTKGSTDIVLEDKRVVIENGVFSRFPNSEAMDSVLSALEAEGYLVYSISGAFAIDRAKYEKVFLAWKDRMVGA